MGGPEIPEDVKKQQERQKKLAQREDTERLQENLGDVSDEVLRQFGARRARSGQSSGRAPIRSGY